MQWFDKSQTQLIRAQPRIQTSRICQTHVDPQSAPYNYSMQDLTSIAYHESWDAPAESSLL